MAGKKGFHHHSARAENAILMNRVSGFRRMTIDVADCREEFSFYSVDTQTVYSPPVHKKHQ